MKRPYSILIKMLVAWYGLFQAVHIFVNVRGLLQLAQGSIDFPALPPPGGWSAQAIYFLTAMASLDLLNAILTLLFLYGFFRQTRWHVWLGTLTLTVSMYAALAFDYATWASGAWTGNLPGYLVTNIAFLPVVLLFVLFSLRAALWETGNSH